ncbi:MAG: 4-hydroxythreonine-4-phosphate dehydrogenase PdxA [Prevotellaceae bacterium]|nr:4-hydroxythreonine-4-phosphate dehydrogenase PdxA [Prevotellaceae bacterium]
MEERKIRVALTHGDTNGIGYELIFKTFEDPEMLDICTPVIYGSPKAATYHRKALDLPAQFSIVTNASEVKDGRINLLTTYDEETKIEFGAPTQESGDAAIKALDRAMSDYRDGAFDILVNAPVDNDHIQVEGYPFHGITPYIETCLGEGKKVMPILINDQLRVASVTDCLPLNEVAAMITKENVEERARLLFDTLRRDFRISNPRIAVLALNPVAEGEGKYGKEETEAIIPAITAMEDDHLQAFGPYAAEDLFGKGWYTHFDAILAMYHDQGVAPMRALSDADPIVYNAGLPVISTALDITPDFEEAGKNIVSADTFRQALFLAIDAFRNRNDYEEPLKHPLGKLYHDKREDADRARFSIPKKHAGSPFPPKHSHGIHTFAPKSYGRAPKPEQAAPAKPKEPTAPSKPSAPTATTAPAAQ